MRPFIFNKFDLFFLSPNENTQYHPRKTLLKITPGIWIKNKIKPINKISPKLIKIICFQYFFQIIKRKACIGCISHKNEVSGRLKNK